MSKIGEKLLRGATAKVVTQAITVVVAIAVLPLVIHKLGERMFPAWVLIRTITGYYGLLDLGLSLAVARFVSRYLGRDDKDEANRYISASFYIFCAGGIIVFIVTVLAAFLCRNMVADPQEAKMFSYALLIAGTTLAITFPTRCFGGILRAHLRFDMISAMDVVFALLQAGLTVTVLLAGKKLVALALVVAGVKLTRTVVSVLLAFHVHGTVNLSWSVIGKGRIGKLFKYASFSFIAQVTNMLQYKVTPFIITGFMGLIFVTPFEIALRLRREIMKFCTSILSMMMPVFSQHEGKGDHAGIKWAYFFIYKISCYAGTFIMAMLVIFADDFIHRWLRSDPDFIERWTVPGSSNVVMLIYLAASSAFFVAIQIPTDNLLFGTSRNKFFAAINAVQAIGTVSLSIILIEPMGLMGVLIAEVIFSVLVKTFLQAWGACRILEISLLDYHLKHTLPNLLKPAVFMALVAVAAPRVLEPNYVRLFLSGIVATGLFLPYIFFVGFTKAERGKFLQAAKLIRE